MYVNGNARMLLAVHRHRMHPATFVVPPFFPTNPENVECTSKMKNPSRNHVSVIVDI